MIARRSVVRSAGGGVGYLPPGYHAGHGWGMGYVASQAEDANMAMYTSNGTDDGHSPEEIEAIRATVNAQATAAAQAQADAQAKMNTANSAAVALATQANAAICARNDNYPCGQMSPCFADANRTDPSVINANYDHLGVSCVGAGGNPARTWFPRTTSPAAIAEQYKAHTAAQTYAESKNPTVATIAAQNGVTVEQLQAMMAANNLSMAQMFAQAQSNTGGGGGTAQSMIGAGAPAGTSTGGFMDMLTNPINIAGFEVPTVALLGVAVVALMAFSGRK